jgi:hypothetical protein
MSNETTGWTHQDAIETDAPARAIWRVWSDVEGWGSWIGDIEKVSIDGPFAAGSTISMKPIGQELVRLRLSDVVENEQFVDVAEFDGVVIRTLHRIERIGDAGRLRIVYRMEISGPQAATVGPELGPQITADFPEVLAALVARAEQ